MIQDGKENAVLEGEMDPALERGGLEDLTV